MKGRAVMTVRDAVYVGAPEKEAHRARGRMQTALEMSAATMDDMPPGDREPRYRKVTAIIEVKGCWNDKLQTDMGDQLLGTYLRSCASTYGLYLVRWFKCDKWDTRDYRRNRPNKDMANKSWDDAQQASALSASYQTGLQAKVLDISLPYDRSAALRPKGADQAPVWLFPTVSSPCCAGHS